MNDSFWTWLFCQYLFLFYLLIVNINVLHYTIRNLYSVVSLNKVMLKAERKNKTNRDTFNSITLDKAKDYFGSRSDLCNTFLVIFNISKVHSPFQIYIHTDDAKSRTTIHVQPHATSFARTLEHVICRGLGLNQQPLVLCMHNNYLPKNLKGSRVEPRPVWRGCVCDNTVAQMSYRWNTRNTHIRDDGCTTYSCFHKV